MGRPGARLATTPSSQPIFLPERPASSTAIRNTFTSCTLRLSWWKWLQTRKWKPADVNHGRRVEQHGDATEPDKPPLHQALRPCLDGDLCRSAASCSAVTWLTPLAAAFFRSSQQARRRPTSPGPSARACIACGGVQTLGVRYEPLRSCTSTAGGAVNPTSRYAVDASPSSMRKGHSRQEDVRVSSTAPLRSTDWLATYAWTIPRDRMALRTGKHRAGTPPRQTLQHARWTGARWDTAILLCTVTPWERETLRGTHCMLRGRQAGISSNRADFEEALVL